MKVGLFRVVEVYAPKDQTERVLYFRLLGPLLVDPVRLVLMWDLEYMNPKLYRGRCVSGGLRDRSLVDLIGEYSIDDIYRVDHPGGIDVSPSLSF